MGGYLAAVWRCRHFWVALVQMDLRQRYRGSVLGIGWSLLHPIAMTIILCVVFHRLMGESPIDYATHLLSGLSLWTYLTSVTTQGCKCFHQGQTYIRQHPMPMAIYPLRAALGGTVHFLMALGLVLALAVYRSGLPGPLALLSLLPGLVLLLLLTWSLAVMAGIANVFFRDTEHLLHVGIPIVFYATPVLYPHRMLRGGGIFASVVQYNPVVPFIELLREPLLHQQVPGLAVYGVASLIVVLTCAAAVGALARFQRRLIFYL